MATKRAKLTWRNSITFLYLAFCLGFPLGLLVLTIGPAAWMASYAQKTNMSLSLESSLGKIIVLLFFIFTILIALWLTKVVGRIQSKGLRFLIFALPFAALVASLSIFSFKPQVMVANTQGIRETQIKGVGKGQFILGSYPDRTHLDQLKYEGYTAVVSLLHEMVIPAEPVLIEEEEENAKQAGIKIIRIPLLPWVSGNEDAIQKIKDLAVNGKGKYYVHCYLGRDRVNVFKTIVKSQAAEAIEANTSLVKTRSLDDLTQFERGPIIKLAEGVYLTPYPTEEEMFGFLLNGTHKIVICILDPKNPSDKTRIEEEMKIFDNYGVKLKNIPITNPSKKQVQMLVDSIKKMERPLVIHGYRVNNQLATALKEQLSK